MFRHNVPVADHELRVGSSAHYEDPAYYSLAYKRRTEDIEFYVAQAQRLGGPVLEYGVGNGRIALPLAAAGLEVQGVDLSRPLLADLRERLRHEPKELRQRVRLRTGDMRSVKLRRRFPVVTCPFNALLHLYTRQDFERFFARVLEHLEPGGHFLFDVSIPEPLTQASPPDKAHHSPRFRHPTTGQVVRYAERFDHDAARQILFVSMEFTPVKDKRSSFRTPLTHRQLYPLETEALLHYNGFKVERVDGGFNGEPLSAESEVTVWHCRRA